MKHVPPKQVRSSTVKGIDPALTLSQDIAKFVIDWVHISKIKRIDSITVSIEGTEIEPADLQQLLQGMFMETAAENSKINVKKSDVKHFCKEHHISFKKKCSICGMQGIRELPRIKVRLQSKEKKAEIHI